MDSSNSLSVSSVEAPRTRSNGLHHQNPPVRDQSLTVEQLTALRRFSEKHGYQWKAKLKSLWASGKDDTQPDGALLRQIRNDLGPKWLSRFSLSNPRVQPDDKLQPSIRHAQCNADAVKSATLVYEDEHGEVVVRYCTRAEANAYIASIDGQHKGCSAFFSTDEICAEMLMDISPNFRERVDEARRKLLRDVRLRDLLTRHGVPEDRALRASINAAFQEFQAPI